MSRGVLFEHNSAFKVRSHVSRVSHGCDGICRRIEEEDWCTGVCMLETWDLVLVRVSRKKIYIINGIWNKSPVYL